MKAVFFLCLQLLLGMVLIGFSSAILQADDRQRQPNIIFILADDMGYGDLGCYGHPVAKTPNIDRLAQEGVLFTQHYSNGAECSPTRTAFLTGRYQHRVKGLECAIGTGQGAGKPCDTEGGRCRSSSREGEGQRRSCGSFVGYFLQFCFYFLLYLLLNIWR